MFDLKTLVLVTPISLINIGSKTKSQDPLSNFIPPPSPTLPPSFTFPFSLSHSLPSHPFSLPSVVPLPIPRSHYVIPRFLPPSLPPSIAPSLTSSLIYVCSFSHHFLSPLCPIPLPFPLPLPLPLPFPFPRPSHSPSPSHLVGTPVPERRRRLAEDEAYPRHLVVERLPQHVPGVLRRQTAGGPRAVEEEGPGGLGHGALVLVGEGLPSTHLHHACKHQPRPATPFDSLSHFVTTKGGTFNSDRGRNSQQRPLEELLTVTVGGTLNSDRGRNS